MRVYIAGAGAEAARVRDLAKWVESFGGEVTKDWWTPMLDPATPHDRDLNDVDAEEYAEADLDAVRRADVLWLVVPVEKVGAGCYFEAGFFAGLVDALTLSDTAHIIVSGDWRRSIFFRSTRRVAHRFDDHADALAWLHARIVEAA